MKPPETEGTQEDMKRCILIVDDEPAMRLALARVLSGLGYRVDQAENGEEALALIDGAQTERPFYDLLLTDIRMPRMSGIELIQELRANRIFLPIIAMSALPEKNLLEKLLGNGCSDYVVKPFEVEDLLQRIEKVAAKTEKVKKKIAGARRSNEGAI
jgi:CheY-like chemotaxis protein